MKKILLVLAVLVISLSLVSQSIVELPYVCNFESEADFNNNWTIENVNAEGDGENSGFWIYSPDYFGIEASGSVVYASSSTNSGDDWTITPGFNLVQGVEYELGFSYASLFSGYPAYLAVYIGTNAMAADMGTLIHDFTSYDNTNFSSFITTITVETTGTYYIGFHDYGPGGGYGGQTIDDFALAQAPLKIENNSQQEFSIYPNPANDFIQISEGQCENYKIYNIEGKIVQEGQLSTCVNSISLNSLTDGVYFLNVECENQQPKSKKFYIIK